MFKIKKQELANHSFVGAVQKLSQTQLPVHGAYAIKRLVDKLQIARKDMQKEFDSVLKKYAQLDEKGAVVFKDGSPEMQDGKIDEFLKAQEEFGEALVEIDRSKLALSFLIQYNVSLSAAELTALEPVLHDDSPTEAVAEKTA